MFSVRVLHESTVQNKLFALVDAMANAALDPVPTFAKGIQPRSSLQRFLYGDSDGIVKLDVRLAEYVLCSLCTDLDFNA